MKDIENMEQTIERREYWRDVANVRSDVFWATSNGKADSIEFDADKAANNKKLVKYQFLYFEDYWHLVDTVENGYRKHGWNNNGSSSGSAKDHEDYNAIRNGEEWTYGPDAKNVEGTKEAMFIGNMSDRIMSKTNELKDKMLDSDAFQNLMIKSETMKRQRKFSESGDELSIDRVLSGNPEHWQQTVGGKKSNIVRLYVNISTSSGHGWEMFADYAATAIVATELLQKAGFFVEINVIDVGYCTMIQGKNAPETTGTIVGLKKAKDAVDIRKIATVGLPALLRYYFFSAWMNLYHGNMHSGGLGTPSGTNPAIKKVCGIEHIIDSACVGEELSAQFVEGIFKDYM